MGVGARDAYFTGTAPYYGRHRPGYPAALWSDLVRVVRPSGAGQLLDLGCGTGEVAIALSRHFESVVAVDRQAELVNVGRREAVRVGTTNITWEVTSAEVYRAADSSFDLLTIANAFHHFDREAIALKGRRWLRPGGCLAIIGCNSVLAGPELWKSALFDVVRAFQPSLTRPTGAAGWAGESARSHGEVLEDAGLEAIGECKREIIHHFVLDDLVGYLHSTWFASPGTLGPRLAEFDAAVRSTMSKCRPFERLRETISFYLVVGRRPI